MIMRKSITLTPNESKVVEFSFTPTEARTYQVSVNGLTGSFRVISMEEPYLINLEFPYQVQREVSFNVMGSCFLPNPWLGVVPWHEIILEVPMIDPYWVFPRIIWKKLMSVDAIDPPHGIYTFSTKGYAYEALEPKTYSPRLRIMSYQWFGGNTRGAPRKDYIFEVHNLEII